MHVYRFGIEQVPAQYRAFTPHGGTSCLLLADTVYDWEGACVDRLDGPDSWSSWLRVAGFRVPATRIDPPTLERVRMLREAIYELARAVIDGQDVDDGVLAVINIAAAVPPPAPSIARVPNGFSAVRAHPLEHNHILSEIAIDTIELFGGPQAARVRICADHYCPTIFLDSSPAGNRQWCSPACGARQATRSYRARQRAPQLRTG